MSIIFTHTVIKVVNSNYFCEFLNSPKNKIQSDIANNIEAIFSALFLILLIFNLNHLRAMFQSSQKTEIGPQSWYQILRVLCHSAAMKFHLIHCGVKQSGRAH